MARRKKTQDGLIEKALDELARTERPIGLTFSPQTLALIDRENRPKRKSLLERLLMDALFVD